MFVTARCKLLRVLLFFLDLDHFAAHVLPAVRADRVRKSHRAAVGASHKIAPLQSIMGASAIAAALGMFALGMWGHYFLLYISSSDLSRYYTFFSEAGRL